IAELRAIEKVSLDTIEVISKDYKNIKEVLRESSQVLRGLIYDLHKNKSISNHIYIHFSDIMVSNLEKLDSPKTEKKEIHIDIDTNLIQKLGSHALIEDSGGEKTEPEKNYKREIKGVKYFSRWRAKEVLEKAKKDCDNRCQKLIEKFLEDIEQCENLSQVLLLKKKWQGRIK
ncbi:unnamed protein product, partial [marine sediment metagenome]